jgi:hypothetical protein
MDLYKEPENVHQPDNALYNPDTDTVDNSIIDQQWKWPFAVYVISSVFVAIYIVTYHSILYSVISLQHFSDEQSVRYIQELCKV